MGYSKVKKIKAVNFRNIASAEVDMSDCPIVAFTGSNESGKSTMLRVFGVAAGNLWRAKQNKWIRTGTDGFAALVELDDGTKVVRKKNSTLNGYTVLFPDGTRRDATKIDVETPDYVEAVMGLFRDVETKESLQVRTYEDPLFLVETTDGQNYKAVHNAINNLDVREASIKAKADAARMLDEVWKKQAEVAIYTRQLSELPLLDTEYLRMVLSALERDKKSSELFDKALSANIIYRKLAEEDVLKCLEECVTVDADKFRLFTDAMRHFKNSSIIVNPCEGIETVNATPLPFFEQGLKALESVKKYTAKEVPEGVEIVNIASLSLFEQGLKALTDIQKYSVKEVPEGVEIIAVGSLSLFEQGLKALMDVKKYAAKEVPEGVKTMSMSVVPLFDKAFAALTALTEATENYNKLTAGIEKVSNILKQSGMRVYRCDKCGNDIVVTE